MTVDKPASSRLGDEQVGWTPAADQNEAGGLLTGGTWKEQCNEHRSHGAKGDPVLPRMEHVLAIKPHREPWVFVGNPRPAASKGKKAVRIPRLREGPQSLRKMPWRAGVEQTLPPLPQGCRDFCWDSVCLSPSHTYADQLIPGPQISSWKLTVPWEGSMEEPDCFISAVSLQVSRSTVQHG